MIEVITPAGFERFFAKLAEMIEAGPPSSVSPLNLSVCAVVVFSS